MLSLIGLQALLHVFPPHPSRNQHRGRRYRTHRVPVQIVGARTCRYEVSHVATAERNLNEQVHVQGERKWSGLANWLTRLEQRAEQILSVCT